MMATDDSLVQLDNNTPSPSCRLLVVKVTARCNLNCTYCYMFNGGDTSYLLRPPVMSRSTADALLRKVYAHCRRHGHKAFTIVFHGGEPLLAPPSFYRHFVEEARRAQVDEIKLNFRLQTNGTLLTSAWCLLLTELGIEIGVSVDGPREINDRHRKDHRGRGSFDRVLAGWNLAVEHGLRPGLLAVIDVQSDPLQVYELLNEFHPSGMDFLLPDATHDKLPPGYQLGRKTTDYADWLIQIFRAWTIADDPTIDIRIFTGIMRSILGKEDGLDNLGTGDTQVMVIESDGEIQSSDVLRICEPGMITTKFNVRTHELDDAFQANLIKLYYAAHDQVCTRCNQCELLGICGGGFLPHRYSASNGFDNPSVYCGDLTKLITEVSAWFTPQIPQAAGIRG